MGLEPIQWSVGSETSASKWDVMGRLLPVRITRPDGPQELSIQLEQTRLDCFLTISLSLFLLRMCSSRKIWPGLLFRLTEHERNVTLICNS
jgi:hypothetical protein